MWRGIKPLSNQLLKDFESAFDFNIHPVFRQYILDHNSGAPTPGIFPTIKKERKVAKFLDFADRYSAAGAWATNRRLRDQIGDKRIIIGKDSLGNFLCLERHYRKQYIVLWNHLTGEFEESLLDIPAFVRCVE